MLGQNGISDPRALASSIGEVLLATASGLFIAIPAFVSYYIFRNRAQIAIVNAEDRLNSLVEDVPFEELAGRAHRREFFGGRRHPVGRRVGFAAGLDGADHELPRVQRRDHRRREPVSALRRDPRLGHLTPAR